MPDIQKHTNQDIELIRKTVAKGATDEELKLFLHLCKKYDLDPFAKEIWFIKYNNQLQIFTSRDGYLKIAHSNQDFNGLVSGVVRENDTFETNGINVNHQFAKGERGKIIGAYCLVYRKNFMHPVFVYSDFSEYNNVSNPTWKKYPSAMIQKVAEAMALKRAFSISGLVTQEELAHEPALLQVEPVSDEQKDTIEMLYKQYQELFTEKELQYPEKIKAFQDAEKLIAWINNKIQAFEESLVIDENDIIN